MAYRDADQGEPDIRHRPEEQHVQDRGTDIAAHRVAHFLKQRLGPFLDVCWHQRKGKAVQRWRRKEPVHRKDDDDQYFGGR